MARHEHLPIFKKGYELTLLIEELVHGFSRYHKYELGSELREQAREILLTIVRANDSHEKIPILDELRVHMAEMQILVRLAKDVKALPNFKAYERVSELIVDISKQMEGWRKKQMDHQGNGQNFNS